LSHGARAARGRAMRAGRLFGQCLAASVWKLLELTFKLGSYFHVHEELLDPALRLGGSTSAQT
jgi:hypothetical protein